jgi:phosphohistidine phosphatase
VELHLSSPLVRAWQTAEILEAEAGWPAPKACDALAGNRGQDGVVSVLQESPNLTSVALVGHEPDVSELVSYFLTGSSRQAGIEFKKGAVACLALPEGPVPGTGYLRWHLPPRVLRGLR